MTKSCAMQSAGSSSIADWRVYARQRILISTIRYFQLGFKAGKQKQQFPAKSAQQNLQFSGLVWLL